MNQKNIFNYKTRKNCKGFSLVELLIVIAVVGVLSTIIIIAINPVTMLRRARDAQRKSDLRQIASALERYYVDKGRYPPYRNQSGCSPAGWGSRSSSSFCGGDQWLTADPDFSYYLPKVPKDPINQGTYAEDNQLVYTYWVSGNGKTYDLLTKLEDWQSDKKSCINVGYWIESLGGQSANYSWCINKTGGTSWWSTASADWLYVIQSK